MGEIATHSMIKDKTSFGSTGTECPVKTTIKSISSYIVIANESTYGSPECVKIEDISALQYYFNVSPWDLQISGDGGASNAYGIDSTKTANGVTTNVSWSIDATTIPSWLTHNSANKTFTAGINTTGAERTAKVYFDQAESGLRDYCMVTQPKRTDVYVFTANPTSLTLDAVNGKGDIDVTSTLNGSNVGWAVTKQPDSWCTVKDSIDGLAVSATNNTSASERSTTIILTQTGSGKTLSITIKQFEAVTEWKYFFSVNTTSHNFPNSGGSYSFTITSYKQYFVNGNQSGSQVTLPYTSQRSSGDSAFTMSGSTVSVSANTTHSKRVATFSLTQTENGSSTGKSLILSVDQDPADDEYEFAITWTSGSNYAQTISTTYPWQVTVTDYKTFYIRSRKNGATFSSITGFTSNASWITVTSTTSFTYSIADNDTGSSRTGRLTLTQGESGKQCYIDITQTPEPAVEEWRYTFLVTPTVVNFSSSEGSKSVTVESYKELYINDVYQSGSKEFVNWSSSEYIAWASTVDNQTSLGTYKGTCTITAIANSTTSDRNGEVLITQSDVSGTSSTVRVTQAAKVEDVYVFTWGDGSVADISAGPFKANESGFTIGPPKMPAISTKNGVTHGYSVTSKPSWLEVRLGDTIVVDLTKNTSTSSRSGSIVLTQNDSGKTLTINLSQTGYEYIFEWYNNNVIEDTGINSYTYTISPGFVFDSTSIMNTLISTKSVDDWATNIEKVDVTVIDAPEISWLTVVVDDYGVEENPGLMDVKLSGTVPQTPGLTYTVQFLQHESAKVCLFKIVVSSLSPNQISIASANYSYGYNIYFQAWDPVASDVGITYTLHKDSYANTNYITMTAGQRTASVIGLNLTDKEYDTVNIYSVSPKSDDTYSYSYDSSLVPITRPFNISADCKFTSQFSYSSRSGFPMVIPLVKVVDFDGSNKYNTTCLTIPAEYNKEGSILTLSGNISFNVEAHNNTHNSMRSITVEFLASDSSYDIGTDQGVLIKGWTESYPTGGLYIWVIKDNESVDYDLSGIGQGVYIKPIYLWFNVKVEYTGSDIPVISPISSNINLNIKGKLK